LAASIRFWRQLLNFEIASAACRRISAMIADGIRRTASTIPLGVRSVVLAINSPGGPADGILRPSSAIRSVHEKKPVSALVGSMAASSGY
jgi:hypothetical protein